MLALPKGSAHIGQGGRGAQQGRAGQGRIPCKSPDMHARGSPFRQFWAEREHGWREERAASFFGLKTRGARERWRRGEGRRFVLGE